MYWHYSPELPKAPVALMLASQHGKLLQDTTVKLLSSKASKS